MNPQTHCLHFNGYKPCGRNSTCDELCPLFQKRGPQILMIHLGALGAVVRSTALLNAILRKYPGGQITWITEAPAHHLLKNHPDLHRVFTLSQKDILELSCLKFDVALLIDKSLAASGLLNFIKADQVFGFRANSMGGVEPATESARELWSIGLSDQIKFHENKKTEIQLITEALELDYRKDDYNLPLTGREKDLQFERWNEWSENGQYKLMGINTGCAATIPAKKLSVQNHRELIRKIQKTYKNVKVILLGGPEDTDRNQQIAEQLNIIQSPTNLGLRDGLVSIAACDLVITGDSLGMHMAISQKKPVIAWFGPTCAVEIELFGRGEKILSGALAGRSHCGPCWKRSCHKPVMCYDLVELDEILDAANRYLKTDESRDSDSLPGRPTAHSSTPELG